MKRVPPVAFAHRSYLVGKLPPKSLPLWVETCDGDGVTANALGRGVIEYEQYLLQPSCIPRNPSAQSDGFAENEPESLRNPCKEGVCGDVGLCVDRVSDVNR